VRDKIACAQFISTLTDGFIKRLQLEGINSLRVAIKRSVAVKVIQQNSFLRGNESYSKGKFNFALEIIKGEKKEKERGKKFEKKIFVIFMGLEIRNVSSAGTSDQNIFP